MFVRSLHVVLLSLLLLGVAPARGEHATIAVAASFRAVALELANRLERATDHGFTVVSGSTGKLYAQIINGAPFDIFMAADVARPLRLMEDGLVSRGVEVYALGQLALWRPGGGAPPVLADLSTPGTGRVALANPRLAPYGAATKSLLVNAGLWPRIASRRVLADNIGATHGLVAAGAASVGFVALSTLVASDTPENQYTIMPADRHPPIEQGGVLLKQGADNPAAVAWFEAINRADFRALLTAQGFALPSNGGAP